MLRKCEGFVNDLYKDSWETYVPGTKTLYKQGTIATSNGNVFTVYDGAGNYIGKIKKSDGTYTCNGNMTEYKESFLKTAKNHIFGKK